MPVDNNTINALLRTVSVQMQQGVKKITLLISSPGGDTVSAFAAYNILRSLPIEITTVNVGTVDSAAMLLYCAGTHRYSLDGAGVRFLIHGNSGTYPIPMDATNMDVQLQQLKNMNQMLIQVLSSVAVGHHSDVEKAVGSQKILNPQEAKEWGFVQAIQEQILKPGVPFIAAVESPTPNMASNAKYVSITPIVSAHQ